MNDLTQLQARGLLRRSKTGKARQFFQSTVRALRRGLHLSLLASVAGAFVIRFRSLDLRLQA